MVKKRSGAAIKNAINISFIKSTDNKLMNEKVLCRK